MNELRNLTSVNTALVTFNTSMTNLNNTIENLKDNKNEINSAWSSTNSIEFISKYDSLISYLSEAYNSLTKYQQKIAHVVSEFEGFDNTVL